jgi:hypothetical protein
MRGIFSRNYDKNYRRILRALRGREASETITAAPGYIGGSYLADGALVVSGFAMRLRI